MFYTTENNKREVPALWRQFSKLQSGDASDFIDWWGTFSMAVKDEVAHRASEDLGKMNFYAGSQSGYGVSSSRATSYHYLHNKKKSKNIVINRAAQIVDMLTSQVLRGSSSIEVLPANSQEYKDYVNAKIGKAIIDSLNYVNDFESIKLRLAKDWKLFGNACLLVDYDHFAGDLVGGVGEAEAPMQPILNDEGDPVLGEDGEPLFGQESKRTGEVRWTVIPRRHVVLEPGKRDYSECSYVVIMQKEKIEDLAAVYPQVPIETINGTPQGDVSFSDLLDSGNDELRPGETWTYKLYYKSDRYISAGYYVYFTKSGVLENHSLYTEVGHGDLPLAWISDWDMPETPYSRSVLDKIAPLQLARNRLVTIMYTNLTLAAHIYWIVHDSSKSTIATLQNSPSVIKYKGSVAPRLERFQTVGAEIFSSIQLIDDMMNEVADLHQVNFGVVPKRMDSGQGIAELDELQNRQMHTPLRKFDRMQEAIARLSLATAGEFYDDPNRTLRVIGRDNRVSIRKFKKARFGKAYDVRVQRISGLSESKASRMQEVKEFREMFPGAIPDKNWISVLGLGDVERMENYITSASDLAREENEILIDGGNPGSALVYQDHEAHLFEHYKLMQTSFFESDFSELAKSVMKTHVLDHETLLRERMLVNPIFAQQYLVKNPQFPLLLDGSLMDEVFSRISGLGGE